MVRNNEEARCPLYDLDSTEQREHILRKWYLRAAESETSFIFLALPSCFCFFLGYRCNHSLPAAGNISRDICVDCHLCVYRSISLRAGITVILFIRDNQRTTSRQSSASNKIVYGVKSWIFFIWRIAISITIFLLYISCQVSLQDVGADTSTLLSCILLSSRALRQDHTSVIFSYTHDQQYPQGFPFLPHQPGPLSS